jgi:hypothetical protein
LNASKTLARILNSTIYASIRKASLNSQTVGEKHCPFFIYIKQLVMININLVSLITIV